jgi:hypothetical protein
MKVTSQRWSSTCLTPTVLARKHLAHVDLAPLVADPAAGGDHRRPVVERVVELLQAPVRTRGGHIQRRGGLHIQRLVRPLVIVAVHELVEAGLLLEHIDRGGSRGIRLQGEVKPLMPPVLLGMARRGARAECRGVATTPPVCSVRTARERTPTAPRCPCAWPGAGQIPRTPAQRPERRTAPG